MFSCVFELTQYASTLQCSPMSFGSLICPNSQRFDVKATVASVLVSLRNEWEFVLASENDKQACEVLRKVCPQTLWQSYRVLMSVLEQESWAITSRSAAMIEAWIPRVNGSACVEDLFNSMSDCVARSTKTDMAGMANLQAVQIRACGQKVTGGEGQPRGVKLCGSDFESPEIRGLRSKLFSPATFTGSILANDCFRTTPHNTVHITSESIVFFQDCLNFLNFTKRNYTSYAVAMTQNNIELPPQRLGSLDHARNNLLQ